MSTAWTLLTATQSLSFESLGLDAPHLTFGNRGNDSALLRLPAPPPEAPPPLALQERVRLYHNGQKQFDGIVRRLRHEATPQGDVLLITLDGPWQHLDSLVYQQPWQVAQGDGTLHTAYKSRVLLGQGADGSRLTLAAQWQEILAYATAQGLPLALGEVEASGYFPTTELRDLTCAEALLRLLRWLPGALCWFDHHAEPDPVLHLRQEASLVRRALQIGEDALHAVTLEPLSPLAPPSVTLKYEQTHHIGTRDWCVLTEDTYPPTATQGAPGAIVLTLELAGSRARHEQVQLATRPLVPADKHWWLEKLPWLQDSDFVRTGSLTYAGPTFEAISVRDAETGLPASLPNEITSGRAPSWLGEHIRTLDIEAKVTYYLPDAQGQLVHHI